MAGQSCAATCVRSRRGLLDCEECCLRENMRSCWLWATAAGALLLLLLLLPVRVQPRLPFAVLPVQLLRDQLVQGWRPCSLCVCVRLELFSFVSVTVEVDVIAPPCHLLELIRLVHQVGSNLEGVIDG